MKNERPSVADTSLRQFPKYLLDVHQLQINFRKTISEPQTGIEPTTF